MKNIIKKLLYTLAKNRILYRIAQKLVFLHNTENDCEIKTNGELKVLKKYIPNGTKAKSGQKCEECSSRNLIYQEGCLICTDCGSAKCG